MKFQAILQLGGKTATGIPVPPDVIDALGGGKRPAITVLVGGYAYRSTVGSMDGQYMIPVSAEHRVGAGINAGDVIDVDIVLDTAPREITVPEDFAAALDLDPEARRFFDGLSNSNRKRFVLSIEDAKTPETRLRRIEKAVATLHCGKV